MFLKNKIFDSFLFLQVVFGSLWVLLVRGYGLRPDNSHQYLTLSKWHPEQFPPLPWLTHDVHHVFSGFVKILMPLCGSVQNVFFFIQLIAALLYVGGIFRIVRVFSKNPFVPWIVLGLLLLSGNGGYHPILAYFKFYLTPNTLGGVLALWACVYWLDKKYSASLGVWALTFLFHQGYLAIAFISILLMRKFWREISKKMWLFFFLSFLARLFIFVYDQQWNLFALDQMQTRAEPLNFWQSYRLFEGKIYLSLVLISFFVGRWVWLDISKRTWVLFHAFCLLIPLTPHAFQFRRIVPHVEAIFLSVSLAFLFSKITKNMLGPFLLVAILSFQWWQEYRLPAGYFGALKSFTRGATIDEKNKGVISWVKNHTDKNNSFVIWPYFVDFKSAAQRVSWGDVSAMPWTVKERQEWGRRLSVFFGEGVRSYDNPQTLHQMPFDEVKKRAQTTSCDYLVWPRRLVGKSLSNPTCEYRDDVWAVYRLD